MVVETTWLTTSPYAGLYEMPGGNLDFGEEIFASVQRETFEETGLKVRAKKIIAYTNDVFKEANKHEVTLYVLCEREDASQQPEVSSRICQTLAYDPVLTLTYPEA